MFPVGVFIFWQQCNFTTAQMQINIYKRVQIGQCVTLLPRQGTLVIMYCIRVWNMFLINFHLLIDIFDFFFAWLNSASFHKSILKCMSRLAQDKIIDQILTKTIQRLFIAFVVQVFLLIPWFTENNSCLHFFRFTYFSDTTALNGK